MMLQIAAAAAATHPFLSCSTVIEGAARRKPREYSHLDPAALILETACFSGVLLEAGAPLLAVERGAELLKKASIYRTWTDCHWGKNAARHQPNTTAHLQ